MIDRIKQVMTYKNLTSGQFAEKIEMNRSNLTHIFTGRHQPSLDIVRKMLHEFPDINPDWLIDGTGNMLRSSLIKTPEEKATTSPTPTKKILELDLFADENNFEEQEETFLEKKETENIPVIAEEEKQSEQIIEPPIKQVENNAPQEHIPDKVQTSNQIFNSQEIKKIEKIVFFFDNQTFEVYFPG